jgi:membrane-bound serine protease (ClpP class)
MGELLAIDAAVIDPNLVYLALVFSLWIGVTAAYVPGTGFIEVLALAGLVGSLVVLSHMPVQWWAVLLLVVGVSGFMVMPFIKTQLAALAVGGLALQGIGALLLFSGGMMVSPFVIFLTLAIPLAYHQWVLLPMLKTVSQQPTSDKDELLIGMRGRVTKEINPIGTVNVNSELWTAASDEHLKPGDEIVVVERNGLQLVVEGIKRKRRDDEPDNENHNLIEREEVID